MFVRLKLLALARISGSAMKILEHWTPARLKVLLGAVQTALICRACSETVANTVCL